MALPYPTLLSSIIVKICLIGPIVGTKHTKKKIFWCLLNTLSNILKCMHKCDLKLYCNSVFIEYCKKLNCVRK